jgi:regulator of ribonuclease activity A
MPCVSRIDSTRFLCKFFSRILAMNPSLVISTCDFCDAHKSDESGRFRVLPPVFKDYGSHNSFYGQVLTVKCFEDNSHVKAAVESEGHGRVLVVDGAGSLRRALLGGNLAASAAQKGWAGVVVYGCVRDAAELAALPIGICALALNPMPTVRAAQGQTGGRIEILGVAVRTGDWLYADRDGMVVNPDPLHIS